jgi:hypothetical protein
LRAENGRLSEALRALTRRSEELRARYLKLVSYMRRLHDWLSEKER